MEGTLTKSGRKLERWMYACGIMVWIDEVIIPIS